MYAYSYDLSALSFYLIFILVDHLPGSLCKGHKMIINGNPVMGTPNTISSSKP